ncbi:MAG TPA: hypothetical protein VFL57_11465 [Bryobacteraceae bacterium]|nr:hypothetical protein [Bryobacteraceae bacterium]
MVIALLGGTFVLALAIDRGVPNTLEAAADIIEAFATRAVANIRRCAVKLRARHAEIERANRRRHRPNGIAVAAAANETRNAA